MFAAFIPIAAEFLLNMCDVVLLINVSQSCQIQFTTEYFIDQKRYFSLIQLHMNAAFCIGLFILIATGTMFIVYLQLACGMFKISRNNLIYKTNIEIVTQIQIIQIIMRIMLLS